MTTLSVFGFACYVLGKFRLTPASKTLRLPAQEDRESGNIQIGHGHKERSLFPVAVSETDLWTSLWAKITNGYHCEQNNLKVKKVSSHEPKSISIRVILKAIFWSRQAQMYLMCKFILYTQIKECICIRLVKSTASHFEVSDWVQLRYSPLNTL